ncbi:type II toxin-antitoxin system PemK/MazF family toxin [Streptomyces sp. WAC05374]|uniref:type II toxin-antitoxin system PemK/MazF family toxin n=1 Tax=Streptomyces sp. WAC05374 TaxID=2487420 RepID=UPI000F8629C5|nr:type II toxin-antitoxin system PemK/MazF family toxin [Streptomyces sp. WAC05374]RST12336.1 type II toxin-antitoxin system PemK/MazF family toxin [Streptomyces sp. WAC05374]TDF44348.1 type II toxin-antitoxin system PemK/MazF family toxin [Streptomyces sp. WAC05374]TDF53722.1 type II toxin-antitoxin system PemK/MazF family toxin [Streptomyces sp. WAC05374]TDF58555.1 type II toxin-antitoxin system PemK/MazF family toxin [Streptomyces sp. WAC05374]
MDTSWWPALGAVVVIALVAAASDASGRGRRPGGRTRPPARPGRPAGPRPRAGEIWWADVPYEDGPGSKDRPCLVLAVRGDTALVAKITSRYRDDRPGVIALRPDAVGDARGRPSFLETDELRDVPVRRFRRRAGRVDPLVWDRVRHLSA